MSPENKRRPVERAPRKSEPEPRKEAEPEEGENVAHDAFTINVDAIPADLRSLPNWVAWRSDHPDKAGAKMRKVPIDPHTGYGGDTTDPKTWGTIEQALTRAKADRLAGIGFVFTEEAGLVGIDLDYARDPESGELDPWAQRIVERLSSYTESSVGGEGVHVIVRAVLPGGVGRKNANVEMYSRARYFVVTGSQITGTPSVIAKRTDQVAAIYEEEFGEHSAPGHDIPDDEVVLAKARSAKNGSKFSELEAGGGPDDLSAGDAAFCHQLAYWFGNRPDRIDAVFRRSKRMRTKWDSKRGKSTWGAIEIMHAISRMTKFYDWTSTSNQDRGHSSSDSKQQKSTKRTLKPIPPQAPYPIDAVPEPIRSYARAAAQASFVNVSAAAPAMLVAVGSAAGNAVRLRVTGTWSEPSAAWYCHVAESGHGKSPMQDCVMRFLRREQDRALLDYSHAMQEYEKKALAYANDLKASRHSKIPAGPAPVAPACKRFCIQAATLEAAVSVLSENPRGVCLDLEEAATFFDSFDAYRKGKGGDRAEWLKTHGGRPLTVDRKTGKRITHVRSALVSVVGGIQPAVLKSLMTPENFRSGLVARIVFSAPEPVLRTWPPPEIPSDLTRRVERLFDRLLQLEPGVDEHGQFIATEEYSLTPEARERWANYFNERGKVQIDLVGDESAMEAKGLSHALRFAVMCRLVRWADGEHGDQVDDADMAAGIKLSQWHCDEARRVYAMLRADDAADELHQMVRRIRRMGGSVTLREWMRSTKAKSAAEARADLQRLVDVELGRWEMGPVPEHGGRQSEVFIVSDCTAAGDNRSDSDPKNGPESPASERSSVVDCHPDGDSPEEQKDRSSGDPLRCGGDKQSPNSSTPPDRAHSDCGDRVTTDNRPPVPMPGTIDDADPGRLSPEPTPTPGAAADPEVEDEVIL